ncbi:MAG TPA: nitroreductase/quinone reductase family protein [Microbacterium sp.]|uniref:nitroreductase/quinone reductase family protein n=1 Tax=Microbacterium sp. TaxID=51671 RepID=UPI002B5BDC76|nr:nitroreductase/quinone reductase family protein [Microbacterium sp.]HWI29988.1 nitroreductase/quinone reductase family protein [Microbacterium sp.]
MPRRGRSRRGCAVGQSGREAAMSLRGSFRRAGARIGVWSYRRTNGRAMTSRSAPKVLLLTTPGRHSGEPRSTCVAFLESDGGYVVWGTASGARRDPHWFRNLRAAGGAEVQILERRFFATAEEYAGAEREAVWNDLVLARVPGVRRYAAKAGRTIPVAILRPTTRPPERATT